MLVKLVGASAAWVLILSLDYSLTSAWEFRAATSYWKCEVQEDSCANRTDVFYELNYSKDFHSCTPDDPYLHVCGLNAQFHCTVTDCRTCTQQRIDSVNGHGLLDQLSTQFPVCCDTGLEISPESFSSTEQYLPTSLVGLSISVHKDTET